MNRVTEFEQRMQGIIDGGGKNGALATEEKRQAFEETNAITFDDHYGYQNAQSRAHASGKLSTEEAQAVYIALGEVWTDGNGGWAAGTGLALKVTVTTLVGELITA